MSAPKPKPVNQYLLKLDTFTSTYRGAQRFLLTFLLHTLMRLGRR